ncbi:hypothetical protein Tco_1012553 [Tanacetum coccineum]
MKKFMETLPTLIAPIHGEVLMMYLAALTKSISAALFTRREEGQAPTVAILTNSPIKQAFMKLEKSGRVAKWEIELGELQRAICGEENSRNYGYSSWECMVI